MISSFQIFIITKLDPTVYRHSKKRESEKDLGQERERDKSHEKSLHNNSSHLAPAHGIIHARSPQRLL